VEFWLELGRGPLFRLAFALMVLGLGRIVVLTLAGALEAWRRSPDRMVDWRQVVRRTAEWLIPVNRLWRRRPLYSTISLAFHIGLLAVPPFLAAHILLWERSTGLSWAALPQAAADGLTLAVIVSALLLVTGRLAGSTARAISRRQDYLWPLLLATPFASGYACSNLRLGPASYQALMLVHVYSGDLVMALIPFTKIAHCVLAPLSQLVTALAWKFPVGAGDRVAATLGYGDRPSWLEGARSAGPAPAAARSAQEVCAR